MFNKNDEESVEDIRNIIVKIPLCSKWGTENVSMWLMCVLQTLDLKNLYELIHSVREETEDSKDDDISSEPDRTID